MGNWVKCFFTYYTVIPSRNTGIMIGRSSKLCTLLKKRNPIMERFRLQGSRVEASPSESCSFGEAVMSLFAEERNPTTFHY